MIRFLSIDNNPSYLLEQDLQKDSPLPVFKTLSEILAENLLLFGIITILVLSLAYFWYRLKNKRKQNSQVEESIKSDPYKDALLAISELQRQQQHIGAKPFVFKLSEILRIYIEKLFRFPAMELTGEEFMVEIASHSFFKNRYEDLLKDFVDRGDRVKYSKENIGSKDIDELLESALHFVKDTNAKLVEQENREKNNEESVVQS